uniref:Uncharacterized protein n=1 Tax=Wuchereria bancrofti TaxID=6293 RepID=A0AAF5PS17_WUCBA
MIYHSYHYHIIYLVNYHG